MDKSKIKVLITFGNKINAINLAYTKKLSFEIWKTNINILKLINFSLADYKMVIARF